MPEDKKEEKQKDECEKLRFSSEDMNILKEKGKIFTENWWNNHGDTIGPRR